MGIGAMLTGLFAGLKAKGAGIAMGVGATLVAGLLVKVIPGIVSKQVGKKLDDLLDSDKPEDVEFLTALVKWVEIKTPDRGQGEEKFAKVVDKVVKMFPFMSSRKEQLATMIEEAVWRVDEELDKRK